ncbi:uncharacterized protein LOC121377380 [Gigantopelta aegis]|uniref:uncharacterized protein LOC121377380 n=1 Tax=Gigantopelta aegis TaxID=1735272 RepID=UPI001B88B179|nr:uncharacterized protein LOC121377380 [Gigantopelta aegis]
MAAGGKGAVVFLMIELSLLVPYIVAFSLDTWTVVYEDSLTVSRRANMGLWWGCGYDHDLQLEEKSKTQACFSMLEAGVPAWLRAVQAFAILGIFFGVVCVVLTGVMTCGPYDPDRVFKVFLPVWYFAGFAMLLAIVIFGASMPPYEKAVPVMRFDIEITRDFIIQKFWTAFIVESIAACLWNAFGFIFLCAVCCS